MSEQMRMAETLTDEMQADGFEVTALTLLDYLATPDGVKWVREQIEMLNGMLSTRSDWVSTRFDWVDSLNRQIERIELERAEIAVKRDKLKKRLAELEGPPPGEGTMGSCYPDGEYDPGLHPSADQEQER